MFRIREEGRQEAARDPQTAITRQWILDVEASGMVHLLEVWVLSRIPILTKLVFSALV
jgi:hypothetical protein